MWAALTAFDKNTANCLDFRVRERRDTPTGAFGRAGPVGRRFSPRIIGVRLSGNATSGIFPWKPEYGVNACGPDQFPSTTCLSLRPTDRARSLLKLTDNKPRCLAEQNLCAHIERRGLWQGYFMVSLTTRSSACPGTTCEVKMSDKAFVHCS